ncbi:MAG: amidase [Acidimicrobiia bacterium]|nr:amidase [Acidimicrobiia bacterium]
MPHAVTELAERFASGSMTPTDAMEDVLDTVDRLDGTLHAWQEVYASEARRAAVAATEQLAIGARVGPFHGIPFALKDIVDVEGRIATAGSAALRDRRSPTTATIARRLLAAGGVLVGKTRTVELALGGWGTNQHLGTPRNPWDASEIRVPGGSSSGSGVAVASGMIPCAIGTDTGGSVRIPASLCGIVGLKTTEGLLPTDGIVPLSHTLDTPGPLARSVADAALMFDVLTGRSPIDIDDDWRHGRGLYRPPDGDLRGISLGTLAEGERSFVSADVLHQYDRTIDCLADLGADLRPLKTPLPYEELKELTFTIVTAEAWHHHGELFADDHAPLDEHVRARALPGRDLAAVAYVDALEARQRLRADLLAAMDGIDALLTPTTPDPAPLLSDVDEAATPAHFTRAGNLLALAALSVPTGLTPCGLPAAVQFVGRGRDEALLLELGTVFERARGPLPTPPIG